MIEMAKRDIIPAVSDFIADLCQNVAATMVFKPIFASATFACEPSILNSNLLPVNAKGEVLFLSVASLV